MNNEKIIKLPKQVEEIKSQMDTIKNEKLNNGIIKEALNVKITKGVSDRRPMLVLSFDDGLAEEYIKTKPLLDSLGVKGTLYHNTSPNFRNSRLSEEQLISLYKSGWDIGSHSRDHVFLGEINGSGGFTVGSTQIVLNNPTAFKLINTFEGIKTYLFIKDTSNSRTYENVEVVSVSAITSNKITLTLASGLKHSYTTPLARYSDDFIKFQLKDSIDYIQSLNIPCKHFAFPYGATSTVTKELVAKYFSSGRNAYELNTGLVKANAGTLRGTENALDQFEMWCGDLGGASNVAIDNLLNDVKTKSGFGILLGHASNYDAWVSQLTYTVNKCRELDIEVVTMSEALECHGNLIDLGQEGFRISRSGLMRGHGVNIEPVGSVPMNKSVWSYKEGITFARAEASDNLGFPTTDGTLMHIKTSTGSEGAGWSPEFWFAKDGNIFYRLSNGYTEYTAWEKLYKRKQSFSKQVTIPSFDVGAGGTYHLNTGITVGTNSATVNYTAFATNGMSNLVYNNIFVVTKMEGGTAFLSFINKGTATYTVPSFIVNVEVTPVY